MPDPQEPQDKTRILYDAVGKEYSLGTYDEFKTKLQDPAKRKLFYDSVGKDYALGTYDEFESKVGVSKKKAVSQPLSTTAKPSSNGAATPLPTPTVSSSEEKPIDIEAMAMEGKNPIDVAIQVRKNALPESNSGDDQSGIEASKRLREAAKKKYGIDDKEIDEIGNDFADFPAEAHERTTPEGTKPFSTESLLKLRAENKPEYQRTISQIKNQYEIKDAYAKDALEFAVDPNDPDKDFKASQLGIRKSNEYNNLNKVDPMDLNQVEQNTKEQLAIINAIPDESLRNKLASNLQKERAITFIPNNYQLQQRYAASPLKDKINPVQYAALEQLRLFDPKKASEYEQVLGYDVKPEMVATVVAGEKGGAKIYPTKKKESDDTVQERLGKESVAIRLNKLGRGNELSYLLEKYYNAKRNGDIDAQNAFANQINQTATDIEKDKGLFPISNQLEVDKKVMELTQKPSNGIVGNFFYHVGKTLGDTVEGAVDIGKVIVGAEDSAADKAESIGETEQDRTYEYIPSSYALQQNGLILAPDAATQKKVKEIQDSETLTAEQKRKQLEAIASPMEWVTNPELTGGKKMNVTAKSLLYNGAGMLGDIASFAATSYGMGGFGAGRLISSAAPLFTSTYAEKYNQAIYEGMENPNEYATLHAAIPALIAAVGGSPLNRVKAALGTESKLGQMVAGLTEKEWAALASKEAPMISKFKSVLGNTVKEGANLAGTWGALPSVAGDVVDNTFFGGNKSAEDIMSDAVDASKHAFLSGLPLLGIGAVTRLSKSPYDKAALWDIADTPDIAKMKIDDAVKEGKMTEGEANTNKATIDEVSKLIDKVPKLNAKDKFYTDAQRMDILANLYLKNKAKESKGVSPSMDVKADKIIAQSEMANDLILEPKTDKQLETLKGKLERQLEEKDEQGQLVLKDKQRTEVQGQLDAVNEKIEENEVKSKRNISVQTPEEVAAARKETTTTTPKEDYVPETKESGVSIILPKPKIDEAIKPETNTENKQGDISTEAEVKPIEAVDEVKPAAEEGKVTGITHAETDAVAKEIGLETYEESPETVAKWDAEADTRLKDDPKAISKLLTKLNDGIQPDKVDQRLMLKYMASLKAKIDKTPTNELISEYKKAKELSDIVGGREVAKSLVARKGLIPVEDNLADYMVREMEASGVGELTEGQKTQATKEYNEIKEANEAYKLKIEQLESDNAKLAADKAVKEQKASTPKQKKSHEDFVKEREETVAKLREKLKQSRGTATAVPVPYLKELVTISPEIAKLVKSYVEEGITKLEDIVENLRPVVKELIPESTDKDIYDLISGEHSEKKKPRNELAKTLQDLRTQSSLINKLESLKAGVEPVSEKKKIERNRNIEELSKKIKEHDLTKLAETKSRIKTEIAKVEEDLKTGNFLKEQPKKEPVKPDKEALALRDKYLKLKEDREIRLMKEEFSKQTKLSKFGRYVNETTNIGRVAKSSFDASMPFRQGLFGLARQLLTLPIGDNISFKTQRELASQFKKMYTAMASEKVSRRIMADIHESPRYEIAQKSGLAIAEPLSRLSEAREEVYGPSLLERIPIIGKPIKIGENSKVGGFVKASERAATTFVNSMKFDIFNSLVDNFEANGKTFSNSKELYEAAATYANQAVGRGKLTESVERANAVTSKLFFSLRLQASRLQLLTYLVNPRFYTKVPKEVRIEYLKDMTRFVALGMTTLAIANSLGLKVGVNPFASNFGKVQVGETEYDIWGGFSQWAVYLMRMAAGKKVNSHGDTVDANRLEVTGRFARSKASPEMGFLMNSASGKDYLGRETTVGKEALEFVNPLIINDTREAMKDGGVVQGLVTFLLASHGIGTATYDHQPSSKSSGKNNKQKPHKKHGNVVQHKN